MADPGGANPAHLTLPDNQAALAPFPPGCPVLVSGSSGDSETSADVPAQTYLGRIHSVYIDLGSTTRDNFYRVRPSSAAQTEAATELRSAAESALKYAPGCTVTVNASALPPFVTEGGGGATRDATIISCVGGGVSSSSSYYLLEVIPGPSDSWTNIQSTVPVDSVRYRAPVVEDNELGQDGDQNNRAINNNPHPHMIPTDEDGSLKSTSKDPPVASIAFDNTGSRKRPSQLDADDGGSSTLSPMPTDGSISVASSSAIAEDVVRRIDIPDTVDASKVEGALIGPDNKINQRMQTKFGVIISILGLDDAVSSSMVESFSKLGPISYKVGDKCIMIQGSERKVHDAAKVVIHMLVNKCYDGNDKDTLMRKLRVVRQVRKKVEPSPPRASARPDLPSPRKKIKTGPTLAEGGAASLAVAVKDPVERGWSPPIEDDHQPQMGSTSSAQSAQTAGQKHRPSSCLSGAEASPLSRPLKHLKYSESPHEIFNGNGSLFREPAFRDEVWSVQVRSIIGERELFKNFIGTQYNIRSLLIDRFHLSHIGILTDGGSQRILIEGSDKVGVMEAANYATDTMREMAKPVTKQFEATLSTACSWDGKRWLIDVVSPLSYDAAFGIIIGPGGSIKERLRKDLDCFSIFLRGGNGIRGEDSALPPHVRITDGIRTIVEDAGDHIAKLLRDAKAMAASNDRASNYPPKQGRSRLLMEEPNFDGREWMVKLLSPLDRDSTFEFIIGSRGLRKRALEQKFPGCFFFLRGKGSASNNRGGHEGIVDLPLHVLISSSDRSIAEAATTHIAEMLLKATSEEAVDPSRRDRSNTGLMPNPATSADNQYVSQPSFDGEKWSESVISPLDSRDTYKCIIGEGGARKRELIARYNGGCFFCLRGNGLKDQEGRVTDGPLRVLIQSANLALLEEATGHVAHILREREHKYNETTARSRELWHDQLRMNQPFWNGIEWELAVESPMPEKALFDTIVGPGGRNKKQLTQKFGLAYFTICGEGIVLKDGRRSDGPLRVRVQADDKDYTLRAARHISEILDDANTSMQRQAHLPSESTNPAYDLIAKPSFSEKIREWHINIRSLLDKDSLFDIMIGLGGASKKEFEMRHPNCTLAICDKGIETFDRRPGVGPLRVLVRGNDRHKIIAAAEHAARMIHRTYTEKMNGSFSERIRSLVGETTMRGMEYQVKIRSPIDEEILCDTVFGRNNSQRNKILAVYPSCDISIDGGGIRGNYEESLHVRIVSRRRDAAESAADWIAKMIINRGVCSLCY